MLHTILSAILLLGTLLGASPIEVTPQPDIAASSNAPANPSSDKPPSSDAHGQLSSHFPGGSDGRDSGFFGPLEFRKEMEKLAVQRKHGSKELGSEYATAIEQMHGWQNLFWQRYFAEEYVLASPNESEREIVEKIKKLEIDDYKKAYQQAERRYILMKDNILVRDGEKDDGQVRRVVKILETLGKDKRNKVWLISSQTFEELLKKFDSRLAEDVRKADVKLEAADINHRIPGINLAAEWGSVVMESTVYKDYKGGPTIGFEKLTSIEDGTERHIEDYRQEDVNRRVVELANHRYAIKEHWGPACDKSLLLHNPMPLPNREGEGVTYSASFSRKPPTPADLYHSKFMYNKFHYYMSDVPPIDEKDFVISIGDSETDEFRQKFINKEPGHGNKLSVIVASNGKHTSCAQAKLEKMDEVPNLLEKFIEWA